MSDKQYDKVSLTLLIALMLSVFYMFWAFIAGAFEKHKTWVYSIDINNKGDIASASENDIYIWENRYCIAKLIGHTSPVKSVAYSNSGKYLASGSIDHFVKVWDLTEEKEIRNLLQHTAGVNKVLFSKTDDYIISAGYDDKLVIYDWKSKKKVKELAIKHTGIAISKHNMLAYINRDCALNLYDLNDLTGTASFENSCGTPAFHPEGNILAVKMSGGANFKFIDSKSGKLLSQLQANHNANFGIYTFSPDGQFLVVGLSGGYIEVWDWQQKRLVNTFQGHNLTSINDFKFTTAGELISASGDRSIRIWDYMSSNLLVRFGDGLFRASFSRVLSVLLWLTLLSGFMGISLTPQNRYSSMAVISILTVWSAGLFCVLYHFRSYLAKSATIWLWVMTGISAYWMLPFLLGANVALYTIPLGLCFGYINIMSANDKGISIIPIFLNLAFCGFISFSWVAGRLI